ncbi:hypothetical protein FJTKL_13580 [Diaporthe vaccinii]|uniref:Uncharacterized protein n=1 Tax=Diaporthe vaccinii TaxID=105482 RepID=A0ABR4E9V2_9PEZI
MSWSRLVSLLLFKEPELGIRRPLISVLSPRAESLHLPSPEQFRKFLKTPLSSSINCKTIPITSQHACFMWLRYVHMHKL